MSRLEVTNLAGETKVFEAKDVDVEGNFLIVEDEDGTSFVPSSSFVMAVLLND